MQLAVLNAIFETDKQLNNIPKTEKFVPLYKANVNTIINTFVGQFIGRWCMIFERIKKSIQCINCI